MELHKMWSILMCFLLCCVWCNSRLYARAERDKMCHFSNSCFVHSFWGADGWIHCRHFKHPTAFPVTVPANLNKKLNCYWWTIQKETVGNVGRVPWAVPIYIYHIYILYSSWLHTHTKMYIYIYMYTVHIHTSFFCIFKNSDDGGVVYIFGVSVETHPHDPIESMLKFMFWLSCISTWISLHLSGMTWNQATRSSRLRLRYHQVEFLQKIQVELRQVTHQIIGSRPFSYMEAAEVFANNFICIFDEIWIDFDVSWVVVLFFSCFLDSWFLWLINHPPPERRV